MIIKLFEVRDRATFIPVMTIKPVSDHYIENWLLRRAGFSPGIPCIEVVHLEGNKASWDAYNWGNRTMQAAHLHIEKHFDSLETGAVIDVEFILGETAAPKISERVENIAGL